MSDIDAGKQVVFSNKIIISHMGNDDNCAGGFGLFTKSVFSAIIKG